MIKFYSCIILLVSLVLMPLSVFAVTDKEMEQARVIAAKAYIRYVNDGSGYLDEINPKTMAELENALKPKEKENIKAFLAIPVPGDYKSWDKQKLVEYWAVTAFQDKGLQEKGRGGRIRARSQINKMTIAPPVATPAASPATQATNNDKAATANQGAENKGKTNMPDSVAKGENLLPELQEAEDSALDGFDDSEISVPREANYTWVYIMVLCILVVLVIVLVVYASNVLKKNAEDQRRKLRNAREEGEMSSETREHLESAVADKDMEISMLSKKLESANRQNSELKTKIEALVSEVASLRAALASSEKPVVKETAPENPENSAAPKRSPIRSIFLGRANSKGIFVRADRNLSIGHSVFVLDTTDGFSGTFRVADAPAAWSLALSNPLEYLSAACTCSDLEDTAGVNKIVTESSGTAVFEGGCWRVIRKARIRYE